jgi:hypothetical protein
MLLFTHPLKRRDAMKGYVVWFEALRMADVITV